MKGRNGEGCRNYDEAAARQYRCRGYQGMVVDNNAYQSVGKVDGADGLDC